MNKSKLSLFIGLSLLAGRLAPSTIQAAGHPRSGLIGQVFIGPTCPHIRPGLECPDRPFQTRISVYSDTGKFITEFNTDAEGQFKVTLKQGRYVLVPLGAGSPHPPYVATLEAVVRRKNFTPVIITYDSGLR
jgi:hypothetical protein